MAITDELTTDHVYKVCKPGENGCCRYLTIHGRTGWCCEKHSFLRRSIDRRVEAGTMNAVGDNCEGRASK
jgi:hypothetical protein